LFTPVCTRTCLSQLSVIFILALTFFFSQQKGSKRKRHFAVKFRETKKRRKIVNILQEELKFPNTRNVVGSKRAQTEESKRRREEKSNQFSIKSKQFTNDKKMIHERKSKESGGGESK